MSRWRTQRTYTTVCQLIRRCLTDIGIMMATRIDWQQFQQYRYLRIIYTNADIIWIDALVLLSTHKFSGTMQALKSTTGLDVFEDPFSYTQVRLSVRTNSIWRVSNLNLKVQKKEKMGNDAIRITKQRRV